MDVVAKRCAVCPSVVSSASVFCSKECQRVARVLRMSQPLGDEPYDLADEVGRLSDPLLARLSEAGERHRTNVATILAAYARTDMELDALIWAAHKRGLTERQIGQQLEMRTASVGRRLLAFQARMHGPAKPRKVAVAG